LAYGIDITAHRAALSSNLKTVAVLGHGLHMIYPSIHKDTAKEIVSHGALVTEFSSQSINDKSNFVRRNRIIAGLADATIVVESASKGGALITADIANSYNRDVFALPGRITDKMSDGCNKLIKTNRAAIIESVSDLEYILGWEAKREKVIQKKLFYQMSDEEQHLYDILTEKENLPVDLLCIQAKMPMSTVSALLLNLEFSGLVKCKPGKVFSIV